MKHWQGTAAVASIVAALFQSATADENIRVLADAPLQPALEAAASDFRAASGIQVEFVFGPSPVIHKKITEGEAADVLLIQPNFVAELEKSGKVVPGDHPVIGKVGFGLAVRTDAPTRDISTTESFRQVLLKADTLIFNNVASGDYFAKVLERLGIAQQVKAKTVRVGPYAVFDRLLAGKGDDIGVSAIPVVGTIKGLRLLGPLPPEVQKYIIYVAAMMAGSSSPQAGKAFIAYLVSPSARATFAANAVE